MKSVLVIVFLFLTTALIGCSQTNAEPNVMTQLTAYELLTSGADVILLDVRSSVEFAEEHIPGSVLLPIDQISDLALELFDYDTTLLVICRSGNRSRQATDLLVELGFINVYDIGGIITWPGETVR